MIRTLTLSGVAALSLAAVAVAQPMGGGGMAPDGMQQGSGAMRSGMPPGGPMQPGSMQPGMMGDHTMDFVTKAAQSDEFEKSEGLLAERRSHNPHVKKFAAMMVSAHTKTTMGLKMAIHKAGMPVPPPPALTDEQMHMMSDLKATHGPDFDKTYIDQQVQAHQMTLDVMQGYAQNGRPGPIRDAAIKTAPLVRHHLDMAKDIQSHIG